MTDDFFRNRLDQMIDLRHPLAVLANRMPWQEIEAFLSQRWARPLKAGKKIEDLDLFGPVSAVAGGGVSNAGRPRLPTRLMVALVYLKHAFNESDEDVIQRWGETPTWQSALWNPFPMKGQYWIGVNRRWVIASCRPLRSESQGIN